ncbi:MAG: hypothetical protein ACRD1Z_02860, partial [Vicinamibacteria bacterium]
MERAALRELIVASLPFRQITPEREAVIERLAGALARGSAGVPDEKIDAPLRRYIEAVRGRIEFLDRLSA